MNLEAQIEKLYELPHKRLLVLWFVYLAESFSITSVLPFISFMVAEFPETKKGYENAISVGWICVGFAACQYISGPYCQWLSSNFGRRPVLLLGLLGNAVSMWLFGLSKNLPWAITCRSVNGLFHGNLSVCLAYIKDIKDRNSRDVLLATLAVSWGLGSILGPLVGGYLAQPAQKYPSIFGNDETFKEYPYLLPCLASVVVSLMGYLAGFLFLEESKHRYGGGNSEQETDSLLENSRIEHPEFYPSFWRSFITMKSIFAIVANVLIGITSVGITATFAVWGGWTWENHGLGLSTSDLSWCFSIQGISMLLWQMLAYHHVDYILGPIHISRISLLSLILFFCLCPFVTLLHNTSLLFWSGLGALFLVRGCASNACVTSSSIILLNSCSGKLSSIARLNYCLQHVARGAGPIIAGKILVWSMENNERHFPYDYHFVFFLAASVAFFCFLLTFLYSPLIDYRGDVTKKEIQQTSMEEFLQRRRSTVAD